MPHSIVFLKTSLWKLSKSSMQTTLPLGYFFFVFTSHSFCVFELPLVLVHYGGLSRSTPFRSWVLHFHFRGGVRFNILSIIITSLSLLLRCVCVRFDTLWIYHYFTSTMECVRFDTLSIIIYFTFTRVCVCPVRHPFDYHYFTITKVCVSGLTPFQLSLFHFYHGVRRVRHAFDYHYFTFYYGVRPVLLTHPFQLSLLSLFPTGVGLCHPFDYYYYHYEGNEFKSNSVDTDG